MRTAGPPPEVFVLKPEFLTPPEERSLIEFIPLLQFGEVRMRGVTAKRRVAQSGWHYSFESFDLSPAPELPAPFRPIRDRAAALIGIEPEQFSETLVTKYPPGAGIGWHRDARPFGIVAGISLGATCRMRFEKGKGPERVITAVELRPRSIYFLTGSARKDWRHTIPPVKDERWSITFRTVPRAM